nr:MAG TPA: hypothetical protein [Caudoviricetes sp.]
MKKVIKRDTTIGSCVRDTVDRVREEFYSHDKGNVEKSYKTRHDHW